MNVLQFKHETVGYPKNNASSMPWYRLHEQFYMSLTWRQFERMPGKWLPYMSESEIASLTKSKKLIAMWQEARAMVHPAHRR